jgi:hypothetical protein
MVLATFFWGYKHLLRAPTTPSFFAEYEGAAGWSYSRCEPEREQAFEEFTQAGVLALINVYAGRCPEPQETWPIGWRPDVGFARETFTQPRDQSRRTARAFLDRRPGAAYMTEVESWRELPGGEIEFTMKRLRSAD